MREITIDDNLHDESNKKNLAENTLKIKWCVGLITKTKDNDKNMCLGSFALLKLWHDEWYIIMTHAEIHKYNSEHQINISKHFDTTAGKYKSKK